MKTELSSVIVTSRLILRPFTAMDAPGVLAFAGDQEAVRMLVWQGVSDMDGALKAINHFYRPNGVYALAIRENNQCIGSLALNLDVENEKVSFDYMLNSEYWNKGYMTEALRAVIQMCFEQLEVNRVEASHFTGNEKSGRVMEKCGMRMEGLCAQEVKVKGVFCDVAHYGLTRKQYFRLIRGAFENKDSGSFG